MDPFLLYRFGILLVIAFVYMMFDVFNKRNVPTVFAYSTIVVGAIMTLLYYPDLQTIGISVLLAAVVGSIGYIFYKIGQLGAADVVELSVISLILPIQQAPYLVNYTQFGLPFIISVFIAAGIVALLMIPLYYLPRARKMLDGSLMKSVNRKDLYKGVLLFAAYFAFVLFLVYALQITLVGVAIILVIMVSSLITATFEVPITQSMIEYISVNEFEEGDLIALNLMPESDIKAMKGKIKDFDRLVTMDIIKRMKQMRIKTKYPVYKKAMPLALPIFLGVVLSILFGNIILIII